MKARDSDGRFVKISDSRTCLNCGSDKTYLEDGIHPVWFNYNGGFICKKCRSKLVDNPKTNIKWSPRRLNYKGKSIPLKERVLTGVCSWCHRKVGEGIKRTHIHHLQYHDNDVLKDTIELCPSCHYKESWRLRR